MLDQLAQTAGGVVAVAQTHARDRRLMETSERAGEHYSRPERDAHRLAEQVAGRDQARTVQHRTVNENRWS